MAEGTNTDDARFAISQFTAQVNSADTRAGLLGAALTVLAPVLVRQFETTRLTGVVVGLLVASAALIALAVAGTVSVLSVRVVEVGFSRYSWPLVARSSVAALTGRTDRTDRVEAWRAAYALALIAQTKYAHFRWALRLGAAGGVLLFVAAAVGR